MALGYIALALIIVLLNIKELPGVLALIVGHAFGWEQDVPKPPVWVESTTVGSATGWTPMTLSTGRMTARLQRPTPERSWMQRTFFGSVIFSKKETSVVINMRKMIALV